MFSKILVPLDGSEVAENALVPALDLVKKYNGTLVLLCTCTSGMSTELLEELTTDHGLFWSTPADDPTYLAGRDYLNTVIETISEPAFNVQSVLVKGDEAGAIIGISEAQDINLIVMTKHCQASIDHTWLGNITERVLHHASCPVMLICSNLPMESSSGTTGKSDHAAIKTVEV
jgi:nucleotide-binding universal stress UspA family protein